MRDLSVVIDQIIEVSTNEILNAKLEKIKHETFYKAPEMHTFLWLETGKTLMEAMPYPLVNEETLKIACIYSTMSEDEVRRKFE